MFRIVFAISGKIKIRRHTFLLMIQVDYILSIISPRHPLGSPIKSSSRKQRNEIKSSPMRGEKKTFYRPRGNNSIFYTPKISRSLYLNQKSFIKSQASTRDEEGDAKEILNVDTHGFSQ